jgi:FdhD protein
VREQVAPVDGVRVRGAERTAAADAAAAEEPTEVRPHDRPFAVIMLTPGADLELAAGLFRAAGELVTSAEDVVRHNAVDQAIGRLLMREPLKASTRTLCVSGRTSFEIVQKAWFAGIPVPVAVSAPPSLAVSLAREAGITLVGLVRDGSFNTYSDEQRTAS